MSYENDYENGHSGDNSSNHREDRIPAGTYLARCTGEQDVTFGRASTGTEQIAAVFQLLNEGYEGRKVTWIGNFANEKAIDITFQSMRVCGWTGDTITDLTGLDANEVELVLAYEQYEGKDKLRVKFINPVGGYRMQFKNKLDDGGRKALAARLKGAALASKGSMPASGNGSPKF